jgi:hypothetical protein
VGEARSADCRLLGLNPNNYTFLVTEVRITLSSLCQSVDSYFCFSFADNRNSSSSEDSEE